MRLAWPLVAAIALFSPGSLAGRQSPTAVIQGRVIAGDTGLPLRGATVQLLSEETVRSGTAPQRVTDSRGAYEFAALPAGAYRLIASPPGDQPMYLPTDRPGAGPAVVELSGDEIRRDVDFALPRAGAIGGRVSDQFGQPVAGAAVRIFARGTGGRLLDVPSPFSATVSDDQGRYRAWGLSAGPYYVRVEPRSGAERASASREGYVRTYYPGATSLSEATALKLRTSEDLDNVDVRLELYRTFQLTGLVLDAIGRPAPRADVTLDFVGERAVGTGRRQTTDTNGQFTFAGVVPAEYELRATAIDEARFRPRGSTVLTAAQPVRTAIVASDATDVTLRLQFARTLSGTVTADDGGPPPFGPDDIRIAAFAADTADRPLAPRAPGTITDRLAFSLPGVLAPVLVRLQGLPSGWFLRAVMAGSHDVVDTPIDGSDATSGIRLVVSSRGATLSGTLDDAEGRRAALRDVRLYPDADEAPPVWASRLRRALTDRSGSFQMDAVAPGAYIVLAADRPIPTPIDEDTWAHIRRLGTPVSLREQAREAVTLTMVEWPH